MELTMERQMTRPKVALVIGAGGLKCAASLGLWKVLRREGINIDLAVGCSGGSIFAATIALGYEPDDVERLFYKIWTKENLSRYHYRSLLQVILPRVFGFNETFGLLDDRAFMAPCTPNSASAPSPTRASHSISSRRICSNARK